MVIPYVETKHLAIGHCAGKRHDIHLSVRDRSGPYDIM